LDDLRFGKKRLGRDIAGSDILIEGAADDLEYLLIG